MSRSCLACGKPLGSATVLCHSCRQDSVTVAEFVDVDETVHERVERYFIVSSLRCADCGEIHGSVTLGGNTYTVDDFAIDSVHEWELEMEKEEGWIEENPREVQAVLATLEPEWPQTVSAVRTRLL